MTEEYEFKEKNVNLHFKAMTLFVYSESKSEAGDQAEDEGMGRDKEQVDAEDKGHGYFQKKQTGLLLKHTQDRGFGWSNKT